MPRYMEINQRAAKVFYARNHTAINIPPGVICMHEYHFYNSINTSTNR